MTSKTAKIVVVLAAAGALSGIGVGLAAADSPAASSSTNYTVEGKATAVVVASGRSAAEPTGVRRDGSTDLER